MPHSPDGWHSRGYLPHFNGGEILQTVTFRVAGSLPEKLISYWRARLAQDPTEETKSAYFSEVDEYLDRPHEESPPQQPQVSSLVQSAMLHFDEARYRLLAWAIMPNHVHALLMPLEPHDLGAIVHSWKGWSAHQANRFLNRRGAFWAPDYFDRYIRNDQHMEQALGYIEMNPVRAKLSATPEEWPFGSASFRSRTVAS